MDAKGRGEGGRRMSSVRLVWEDVLKTGWRETQCGGSVSGVFPHEIISAQTVPRMRYGRDMHRIESEGIRGGGERG